MHFRGFILSTAILLTIMACGEPEPGAGSAPEAGATSVREPGSAPPQTTVPFAPGDLETSPPKSYELIRPWTGDLGGMRKRRVIRVLTVYSVGRYYLEGAAEKGLVKESSRLFEKFINKKFQRKHDRIHVVIIPVARNQLIPALLEGRGDIISAGLSITDGRREKIDFSIPASKPLNEILVTGPAAPPVDSIEDLTGKTIFLRHSSSYYESVASLNTRLVAAGKKPISIEYVSELLEDDDLVEMVNAGLLPWAIVDEFKMAWWEDMFDKLVARNDIVFRSGSQLAWGFRKNSPELEAAINEFLTSNREGTLIGNMLKNRYFRDFDWAASALSGEDYERFQALEPLFLKYGKQFEIEHFMLAAQAFQESRLDQKARNPSGAIGVMQIKESTANDKNINIQGIHKVEPNIHAGTKYMDFIRNRYFNDSAIDERDQILLSLAAYNLGPGRMIKLRSQAEALGYDPNIWFDNVELAAAKYVGREPVQYVANIYKYYLAYRMAAEQIVRRNDARQKAGIN